MNMINDEFCVNYDNVVNTKELPAVVRILAMDLQKNPYLVPSDYFRARTEGELLEISRFFVDPSNEEVYSNAALITLMLCAGEGYTLGSTDEVSNALFLLEKYTMGELFVRVGLIKCKYELMTFSVEDPFEFIKEIYYV